MYIYVNTSTVSCSWRPRHSLDSSCIAWQYLKTGGQEATVLEHYREQITGSSCAKLCSRLLLSVYNLTLWTHSAQWLLDAFSLCISVSLSLMRIKLPYFTALWVVLSKIVLCPTPWSAPPNFTRHNKSNVAHWIPLCKQWSKLNPPVQVLE